MIQISKTTTYYLINTQNKISQFERLQSMQDTTLSRYTIHEEHFGFIDYYSLVKNIPKVLSGLIRETSFWTEYLMSVITKCCIFTLLGFLYIPSQ